MGTKLTDYQKMLVEEENALRDKIRETPEIRDIDIEYLITINELKKLFNQSLDINKNND